MIFPQDGPDFGGFITSHTIVKADLWKLGQVKAGDTLKYRAVSLKDAVAARNEREKFLSQVEEGCRKGDLSGLSPVTDQLPPALTAQTRGSGLVHQIQEKGSQPLVSYRQVRQSHSSLEHWANSYHPGGR